MASYDCELDISEEDKAYLPPDERERLEGRINTIRYLNDEG